jgi:hypothetical protein
VINIRELPEVLVAFELGRRVTVRLSVAAFIRITRLRISASHQVRRGIKSTGNISLE